MAETEPVGTKTAATKTSATLVKLSKEAEQLLSVIPEDGSHVGNTFVRIDLGWSAEDYFKIRQELLDNKLVVIGRGRGGSVARAVVSLDLSVKVKMKVIPALVNEEAELYKPLKEWLDSDWGTAAKEDGDFYWVDITGSPSGRKRESGKWSRPDVTFVQVSSYELIPARTVEVSSFEVKRYDDALDLPSV